MMFVDYGLFHRTIDGFLQSSSDERQIHVDHCHPSLIMAFTQSSGK